MPEMTQLISMRVPRRLNKALKAEARRRMLTKSALIRTELGIALGLIEPAQRSLHNGRAAGESANESQ